MKHTKRKLSAILSAVMLCALCVTPAHALEYSIDGAYDSIDIHSIIDSNDGGKTGKAMNGSLGSYWPIPAMSEKRRLNLSFSMASPLQREAWRILFAVPAGQRTDAVCHAVCRIHEQDTLLDAVRTAIREELRGASFTTEQPQQPQQAGDVGDDVLGFLLALQNDGGEEKPDPLF